jgi:hypothetical protein
LVYLIKWYLQDNNALHDGLCRNTYLRTIGVRDICPATTMPDLEQMLIEEFEHECSQ